MRNLLCSGWYTQSMGLVQIRELFYWTILLKALAHPLAWLEEHASLLLKNIVSNTVRAGSSLK